MVLVRPRNPLNIGAVARAMSNFGFRRLRVVNPYEVAFRQARSAVGAADLLEGSEMYGSVAEALSDCSLVVGTTAVRHRELKHPLHPLEEASGMIRTQLRSGRVALMFGTEKFGLSNEDLAHCNWLLNIQTHEAQISMNLGQAVAVCLYELARSTTDAAKPAPTSTGNVEFVSSADAERITASLMDALRRSGYVKKGAGPASDEKARRLVRRLNIQAADGKVLLGMLRKIIWKLTQK